MKANNREQALLHVTLLLAEGYYRVQAVMYSIGWSTHTSTEQA
jgi:hypothetical protein